MASLVQLLAHHRRILLLDAAATRVTVGLVHFGHPTIWRAIDGEAGQAVFTGTAEVLAEGGARLADVNAFLYCEGPGSMLGTRTVAMALRTWQTLTARPAYSYQSLALAGRAEWKRQPRSFSVIADARRDAWHVQGFAMDGTASAPSRLDRAAIPGGERLTPEYFRAWSERPPGTSECSYDLATIIPRVEDANLFHPTAAPDAYQTAAPDYKKWSAQVHSAEAVVRKP